MRRDWFSRIAVLFTAAAITPVALPVSAETGIAAPASSDGVTSPSQEAPAAAPAVAATPVAPAARVVFRGDDALPSAREVTNNPYIGTENLTGDFAYTPPPVVADEPAVEPGEDLRAILGPEVFDRRINVVTPPDTDVEEVIRLLSEKAELNFLYASGIIKGQVTLNLNNVKLGVALNSLLATQQLSIVREGDNVMRIAPRVEVKGSAVELRTIYIKLNWVRADELDDVLQNALRDTGAMGGNQGGGTTRIVAQKETNTLIITDTPGNVGLIRDIVTQLDVPEKQVMIEARLVEFLNSTSRSTGARLTADRIPGGAKADVIKLNELFSDSVTNRVSFGGIAGIFGSDYNINLLLNLAEQNRLVNIIQNPRVITLNNQKAEIDIKTEVPYFEAQQGAAQGVVAKTVKFKETGIKLTVTPNITNTGFLRLAIEPEQNILAGRTSPTEDNPDGVPIVAGRRAKTNVIVKDEDTVVIGGLRDIQATFNKAGMPWILNAPVIGHFFKTTSKNHDKTELTLFVTPRIIKAPVLTPVENYQHSRLDAHWDLPDYFFDDSIRARDRGNQITNDPAMYQVPRLNLPEPAR